MFEPLVFLNGKFVPQSQAALPINDAGLIWGATVTDLCRTFHHKLFRLDNHLRRFRRSCELAHVPQRVGDAELTAIAEHLVENNAKLIRPDDDVALVLFATPGEIGHYLGRPGGPGESRPTLCLHTFPLPFQRYARLLGDGARLITPEIPALASIPPAIKHRSRLHWWLAEQEVHARDPAASALLLDAEGHLTETASANLMLVEKGRVRTPRRTRVLPGVTLLVVEELCRELGLAFEEADLTLADCANADEAILTCTSYCLAPVARINDMTLSCPGPIFEQLHGAWSQKVGLDVRRQILGL